jgi:Asp-tRNA(Asn)/Glu-tRNA(Gln) amidotransferase A subunit family amidase
MKKPEPASLSAVDLRDRIARGETSAADAARSCLGRIAQADPDVEAWAFLDESLVLAQAEAIDRFRGTGRPLGALHGVPVALKDIIDTKDMPTENGTVLDAGRRPSKDAAIVERLRAAGAVILGKTVTTELAVYHPGKTRNPHERGRSPGGSSSGSAAAVAAGMAPLAVGTQTNGSVIRPASYCGVVGFKPSRGLVSRRGILKQSPSLDSVGVFARSVEDAALLADAIAGHDPQDPQTLLAAQPALYATATGRPPVKPSLAFVRSPVWEQADEDVKGGFAELVETLGPAIEEIALPPVFDSVHKMHATVMLADIARNYSRYYDAGREQLSARLRGMIEEGQAVRAVDYSLGLDWMDIMNATLEELFVRYDAILTPAATGEAPLGLESTGSPVFSTIWTYCGVPAVTLPLLESSNGMPIGVQLVGRRLYDGRLLRTARWVVDALREAGQDASLVTGRVA